MRGQQNFSPRGPPGGPPSAPRGAPCGAGGLAPGAVALVRSVLRRPRRLRTLFRAYRCPRIPCGARAEGGAPPLWSSVFLDRISFFWFSARAPPQSSPITGSVCLSWASPPPPFRPPAPAGGGGRRETPAPLRRRRRLPDPSRPLRPLEVIVRPLSRSSKWRCQP